MSFLSTAQVLYEFKKDYSSKNNTISFSTNQILSVSAPMAISAMAYFIMQSIDVIILAIYEGFDEVAYYSVAVKLATLTALALLSVNIVVAPKIAGIDNNKENLAADFLSKPSNLPAVIVIPDRLVPGKKANIWKVPIMRPLIIFKS